MSLRTILLVLGLLVNPNVLFAQSTGNDTIKVRGVVLDGDTVPYVRMRPVIVVAKTMFSNVNDAARYQKLVRDVTKVWPYARLAGQKYSLLQKELQKTSDKKVQKKLIKKTEEEIKGGFENDLKNLTITQGRILIKLLDRQTGETGYELLKEFKSGFSAFTWQTLAILFGHNIKTQYDPMEEKDIERIVQRLEAEDRAKGQ